MDAEMVQLADRQIMGYEARIEPMSADYPALWSQGFDPHGDAVRTLATEPGYYGVYYGTGEPGIVNFVAGMIVGPDAAPVEGLVVRSLPGGDYAADEARPGFEFYPPEAMRPDAPVAIYLAVKPVG